MVDPRFVEAHWQFIAIRRLAESAIKKGDPVMGDLIKRTPYSEITATIELLDSLGVTPEHLSALRKAPSWQQAVTSAVISGDPYLLALLSIEIDAKKAGMKKEEIARLANEDILRNFRNVLLGYSEIKPIERLIDCDADPDPDLSILKGWTVVEHRKDGVLKWDPVEQGKEKCLYLSKRQRNGRVIGGNDLRKEIEGKPVLNANVLDWLLKEENQHLIPEFWKSKVVFFWGTIYRDPAGRLSVRCLNWDGGRWRWGWDWLEGAWHDQLPAALRAQPPSA